MKKRGDIFGDRNNMCKDMEVYSILFLGFYYWGIKKKYLEDKVEVGSRVQMVKGFVVVLSNFVVSYLGVQQGSLLIIFVF